jgi:hypothetical protein
MTTTPITSAAFKFTATGEAFGGCSLPLRPGNCAGLPRPAPPPGLSHGTSVLVDDQFLYELHQARYNCGNDKRFIS